MRRIPIDGTLDLHTFQPRDIASVVEEYVHAAHEAGLREIRVIHGRGKGVQRGIVQAVLEKHPLVGALMRELGATIVKIAEET